MVLVVAQTYGRTGSQGVMVGSGLGQSNYFLVRRWSFTARETAVWWLPQLIGIGGLVVDLPVVAHVARNVPDAADTPLVIADHVRRPVVVHVVQVRLPALHLAMPQSVDEEEEQGQGEGGDHATGH